MFKDLFQYRIADQVHAVQLSDIEQAVADGVSVRHSSPVDQLAFSVKIGMDQQLGTVGDIAIMDILGSAEVVSRNKAAQTQSVMIRADLCSDRFTDGSEIALQSDLTDPMRLTYLCDNRQEIQRIVDIMMGVGVSDGDIGKFQAVDLGVQLRVYRLVFFVRQLAIELHRAFVERSVRDKIGITANRLGQGLALGEIQVYAESVGKAVITRQSKRFVEPFAVRHRGGIGDQSFFNCQRDRFGATLIHAEIIAVDDDARHILTSEYGNNIRLFADRVTEISAYQPIDYVLSEIYTTEVGEVVTMTLS